MTMTATTAITDSLVGYGCLIERREADWNLHFGRQANVAVSAPWRIVTSDGLAFAAEDDGQQFGLPKPVDGAARANALLKGRTVTQVELDEQTADLRIGFDGNIRLEVFNNSMGYEGWQAYLSLSGGNEVTIVGMGGGGLTTYSE
jgi:hypothetical protein